MELSYQKNDNSKLFSSLVKPDLLNVTTIQNYIPIYSRFFALTNANYNSINLKQTYSLYNITSKYSENTFQGKVKDSYGNTHTKDIFFKYSPLLDPVKYMIGKYNVNDKDKGNDNGKDNDTLFNLPSFINNHSHKKMRDTNNTAYIDSFFSYLSSQLLHHHGFIHGLDFYGSFISIKNDFMVNVCDDMDYLTASSFFKKNLGHLFTLDHTIEMPSDTRTHKEPIKISSESDNKIYIQLADIHDLDELDKILADSNVNENANTNETPLELLYNHSKSMKKDASKSSDSKSNNTTDSGSTCSSRSSNTENDTNENRENCKEAYDENDNEKVNNEKANNDNENTDNDNEKAVNENADNENADNENDDEEDDDDEEYSSSYEEDDEDNVMATIKSFPVQLIALEKCEDTLDSLIVNNKLTDDEWGSIVIQILMSLITFQKVFQFTHNDLHTNNVMYMNTDIPYLYYKVNNKRYKVPTFGRIFKIIDFGRAIYKYRKTIICSDSFSRDGDATSQYNCEPYLNPKKPRLDPNMSFDLCRLGCSLFDMIVDDDECICDESKNNKLHKCEGVKCFEYIKSPILRIIINWCMDDKKRNVLYKTNGEERYPDFKLYKMIARTVHNHVPLNVLQNVYFDRYIVNETDTKKIDKKKTRQSEQIIMMDIDAIPCYV